MTSRAADLLDAVRRPVLPRPSTALRGLLVVLLLCLAAAALFAPGRVPIPLAAAGQGAPGGPVRGSPPTLPAPGVPAAGLPAPGPASSGRIPTIAPAGPGRSTGGPMRLPVPVGLVGVAIGLADAAPLAVIRPGDRVDLLALPTSAGRRATVVAASVLVLGVTGEDGLPVLYLALGDIQARSVMDTAPGIRFGVIVRPD